MLSIVYSSTALEPFSDEELAALLAASRATNERLELTGLLLHREGHFLQLIEGPYDVVRERMEVISADPRHDNVTILLEEVISERHFPEWTMGFQAVTGAMVDEIPGYRSTFDDLEGERPVGGALLALRQLIGWFQVRSTKGGSDPSPQVADRPGYDVDGTTRAPSQ